MMKIQKNDESISNLADWERWAGPKSADQWVKGRSAFELANAWCGSHTPAMPEVIRELLDSRDETRGLVVDVVLPEHRIAFDKHGGEPRNADLAFVGTTAAGKAAVTVEAKADEPFGATVSDTVCAALERGIQTTDSNGVRRVEDLVRALFRLRGKEQASVGDLRYQLLTATAGTLAFATAEKAQIAVLIVHEFVTDKTRNANHDQNGRDYLRFLERLSGQSISETSKALLLGPFSVPGGPLFPTGVALFVGKIKTDRRLSM